MATILKRIGKKGRVTYLAQIRLQGYPPVNRTFAMKNDAKDWAAKTERELKAGATMVLIDHTVAELLDEYQRVKLPEREGWDHGRVSRLQWWRKELGSYFLRNLTTAVVREAKQKLVREPSGDGRQRSGATVNRYLTSLSTALSYGVRLEWVAENVVRRVEKEDEPEGRTRFLSRPIDAEDCELNRLLEACRQSRCPDLHDLVVLAVYTGCRANELLRLRLEDIHLEQGGFTVPSELAKNGEARFVALEGEALKVVERRVREQEGRYLFSGRAGGPMNFPRWPWEEALDTAGIKDFRFHDLRHTHASYLAMAGASAAELKESLGHKTLAMVSRYTHLSDGHKRQVAGRLARKIEEGWREGA